MNGREICAKRSIALRCIALRDRVGVCALQFVISEAVGGFFSFWTLFSRFAMLRYDI